MNVYCLMLSFLAFFYSHVFKLFVQELFGSRILYCNLVLYTRIWVWYGNRKKEKLEDICPDENLTFTNSFSLFMQKTIYLISASSSSRYIFSKATDDSPASRTFVINDVDSNDEGVYRCTSLSYDAILIKEFKLHVTGIIRGFVVVGKKNINPVHLIPPFFQFISLF